MRAEPSTRPPEVQRSTVRLAPVVKDTVVRVPPAHCGARERRAGRGPRQCNKTMGLKTTDRKPTLRNVSAEEMD